MRYISILIAILWITPYSQCNNEFMSDEDLPDYDQEEHSYLYDKNGFYSYHEPKSSIHSNSTSATNPRLERDANANLDTAVNRMKMIARITNGIYLTQGFIDGSITSDAFISELLHLGTATPTAIKAMGLDKLRSAFDEISSTKLIKSDQATTIENRYVFYEKLRNETADIEEVTPLVDANKFKDELVDLNKQLASINVGGLKLLMDKFIDTAVKVERMPFILGRPNGDPLAEAKNVLDELKQVATELQTERAKMKPLSKLGLATKSDEIFGSLRKSLKGELFIKANIQSLRASGDDQDGIDATNENIKKLVKLGSLFKDKQTEMANVRSIYVTRQKQTSFSLLLTNGFFEGAADMHKIAKDLNDPWIQSLTSDAGSLGKALAPMSSIGTTAASVDASLGHTPDAKVHALDKVSEIGQGLLPYAEGSQKLAETIKQVDACKLLELKTSIKVDEAKSAFETLDTLKGYIGELKKIQALTEFLVNSDQAINELIRLCEVPNPSSIDDIRRIVMELGTSHDFVKVQEALSRNRFAFNTSAYSQEVTTFENAYTSMTSLHSMVSEHVKALNCLRAVPNFGDVHIAMEAIENVRKINQDTIGDGVKAINKIIAATGELEKLEAAIQNLKGGRMPETDALNQLPDQATHSITLGSATKGIIKMKDVVKIESDFDVVLSHLSVVKEMMNMVNAKEKTILGSLLGLETKFREMSDALKDWKQGIEVSGSKKLKDHSKIFSEAVKVGGIDEDLLTMINSVGNLAVLVQDQAKKQALKKLQASLVKLDSAGLKMSDYSKYLPEAEKSLEALDLFFVKYGTTLHPPATPAPAAPPPPENNDDGQEPQEPQQHREPERIVVEKLVEKLVSGYDWWYSLITFCVGLIVGAIILCVFLNCGCCVFVHKKEAKTSDSVANNEKEGSKVGEKQVPVIPKAAVVKKTKPEKEKATMKRGEEFDEFLDEKVKRQRRAKRIDFKAGLKPGTGLKIDRDAGFIYMNTLYNELMEFQKQQGFEDETLRPKTFFEYFRAQFQYGLLAKKADLRVENKPKETRFPEAPSEHHKALMKEYERHEMPINLKTAVISNPEFYSGDWKFIHHPANYVEMMNAHRWVLTYDPVTKPEDDKSPFLAMVLQLKPEYVCMIGDFSEDGKYIPLNPKESVPPTRNPKVPFVRFAGTKVVEDESVKMRQMSLKRPATDKELSEADGKKRMAQRFNKDWGDCLPVIVDHCFTHLQFIPESKGSVPQDPRPLAFMLTETYKLDNIIVHCENGLGLSASLVAANLAFQLLCLTLEKSGNESGRIRFGDVVNRVRSHRFKALEEPIQLALTAMILLDFTVVGTKLKEDNERMYRELMTCYVEAIEIQKRENERIAKENEDIIKLEIIKKNKEPATSKTAQDTKVEEKKAPTKKSKKSVEKSKKSKEGDDKSKEKSAKTSAKDTVQKSSKSGKKTLGDTPFVLEVEEAKTQEGSEEDQNKKSGKSVKKTLEQA